MTVVTANARLVILPGRIVEGWPSKLIVAVWAAESDCLVPLGKMVDTWLSELVIMVGLTEPDLVELSADLVMMI